MLAIQVVVSRYIVAFLVFTTTKVKIHEQTQHDLVFLTQISVNHIILNFVA